MEELPYQQPVTPEEKITSAPEEKLQSPPPSRKSSLLIKLLGITLLISLLFLGIYLTMKFPKRSAPEMRGVKVEEQTSPTPGPPLPSEIGVDPRITKTCSIEPQCDADGKCAGAEVCRYSTKK